MSIRVLSSCQSAATPRCEMARAAAERWGSGEAGDRLDVLPSCTVEVVLLGLWSCHSN